MKMTFNLSAPTLGNATSSSFRALEPNKIHTVIFKGAGYQRLKDQYDTFTIKFEDANGSQYNHAHFGWESGDEKLDAEKVPMFAKRTQGMYGPQPSQFENLQMLVKHLIHAVAPELLDNMPEFEPVKGKGTIFVQYVTFLGSILEPFIGAETEIKLIKNNKGRTGFPGFPIAISKDSDSLYMRTNYIGKGLNFTAKELETIQISNMAAPTAAPTFGGSTDFGDTSFDTLDTKDSSETSLDSTKSDELNLNEVDLGF